MNDDVRLDSIQENPNILWLYQVADMKCHAGDRHGGGTMKGARGRKFTGPLQEMSSEEPCATCDEQSWFHTWEF